MKQRLCIIICLLLMTCHKCFGTKLDARSIEKPNLIQFTPEDAQQKPQHLLDNSLVKLQDEEKVAEGETDNQQDLVDQLSSFSRTQIQELPPLTIVKVSKIDKSKEIIPPSKENEEWLTEKDDKRTESKSFKPISSILSMNRNISQELSNFTADKDKSEEVISDPQTDSVETIIGNKKEEEASDKREFTSSESFDLVSSALGGLTSLNSYYESPSNGPIIKNYPIKPINQIVLSLDKKIEKSEPGSEKYKQEEIYSPNIVSHIPVQASMSFQENKNNPFFYIPSQRSVLEKEIAKEVQIKPRSTTAQILSKSSASKITKANLIKNRVRKVPEDQIDQVLNFDFVERDTETDHPDSDDVYIISDSLENEENPKVPYVFQHTEEDFSVPLTTQGRSEGEQRLGSKEEVYLANKEENNSLKSVVINDGSQNFQSHEAVRKNSHQRIPFDGRNVGDDSLEIPQCSPAVVSTVLSFVPSEVVVTQTEYYTHTKVIQGDPQTHFVTSTATTTEVEEKTTSQYFTVFETVTETTRILESRRPIICASTQKQQKTKTVYVTRTEIPESSRSMEDFFSGATKFVDESFGLGSNSPFNGQQRSSQPGTSGDFHIDSWGVPRNDKNLHPELMVWPKDFIIDESFWNDKSK